MHVCVDVCMCVCVRICVVRRWRVLENGLLANRISTVNKSTALNLQELYAICYTQPNNTLSLK